MEKKGGIAGITIILLALSVLVMSVAFAISSEKLTIKGSTTINASAKWDVHFENIKLNEDSVNNELVKMPATINENSTIVNYDVALLGYGDFYEFTVDLVNAGNLNAEISSVLMIKPEEADKYIDYTVEYLDGTKVLVGDELPRNSSKTIKVKVQHINSDVVESELKYDMSFALEFVQK